MPTTTPQHKHIKQTTSLCPHCNKQIPAQVTQHNNKTYLNKSCPQHGQFNILINSDNRHYHDARGANNNCTDNNCACNTNTPAHDPTLIEKATTCIALIEIVESCNLKCPTCFAASPFKEHDQHTHLSTNEIQARLNAVLNRKSNIDVLQLSGGEPTLHPQFHDVLGHILNDQRIGYTLLNTNGLRIANEPNFTKQLANAHKQHRKFEIYLQYDGPQEQGQTQLRGADLRKTRQRAIQACHQHQIPVTLAMTVSHHNENHIADAIRWAIEQPIIRGITLQPAFHSGRTNPDVELTIRGNNPTPKTTPHHTDVGALINTLTTQLPDTLNHNDFTPLPCGDPNCHTIGYILRHNGAHTGISRHIDFTQLQGFLKDRIDYRIEDLTRCGCESEPLGHLLKSLEVGPDNVFRIFIKPFMDAWTYDQHRIDRCCVHVVLENGKLESFCRHYALKEHP